jgi:hypothetical protein
MAQQTRKNSKPWNHINLPNVQSAEIITKQRNVIVGNNSEMDTISIEHTPQRCPILSAV